MTTDDRVEALERSLVAIKGQVTKDRNAAATGIETARQQLVAAAAKIDAQSLIIIDQRKRTAAQGEELQKIRNALWGDKPAPTPAPESYPPAPTAPVPTPQPPAASSPDLMRTLPQVRDIVVDEFRKRTTFLPGNGNLDDPTQAPMLWANLAMTDLNAATAPEAQLREHLGALIQRDVDKNTGWPRVLQAVITGVARLP